MASGDAAATHKPNGAVGVGLLRCPPAYASQSSCVGRVVEVISTVGVECYGKHTRQTKSFTESHAFFHPQSVAAPSLNQRGAKSVDVPTYDYSAQRALGPQCSFDEASAFTRRVTHVQSSERALAPTERAEWESPRTLCAFTRVARTLWSRPALLARSYRSGRVDAADGCGRSVCVLAGRLSSTR